MRARTSTTPSSGSPSPPSPWRLHSRKVRRRPPHLCDSESNSKARGGSEGREVGSRWWYFPTLAPRNNTRNFRASAVFRPSP
jgi:hypothetical protein